MERGGGWGAWDGGREISLVAPSSKSSDESTYPILTAETRRVKGREGKRLGSNREKSTVLSDPIREIRSGVLYRSGEGGKCTRRVERNSSIQWSDQGNRKVRPFRKGRGEVLQKREKGKIGKG